jgi:hypothetical protein
VPPPTLFLNERKNPWEWKEVLLQKNRIVEANI